MHCEIENVCMAKRVITLGGVPGTERFFVPELG
jgi:hypothetical protein